MQEVYRYLTGLYASNEDVTRALNEIHLWPGFLTQTDSYFTLYGREMIVKTRTVRKPAALRLWRDAKFYGRILASLPFIRMVAVTGSLAMDNPDNGGDIDYFVVTAGGRLWTCRAMCILIVRLAKLTGVKLCPNYLVADDGLVLQDRSLYAAHELTQMIPLSGIEIYHEMRRLNMWTDEYMPNAQGAPETHGEVHSPSALQRFLEFSLAVIHIEWFENWEMKRKVQKLSGEQSCNPEARFSANICKGHASRHGEKTETAFGERLKRLEAA